MRVAAYVRVSTTRQVKLETIEQQLEMVCKYAWEKGWELPEEDIFRDDGYSGTTLKRPALDALRDKARLREFEAVVVPSPEPLRRFSAPAGDGHSGSQRREGVEHRHLARDNDQPLSHGQGLRRARALASPEDPALGHPPHRPSPQLLRSAFRGGVDLHCRGAGGGGSGAVRPRGEKLSKNKSFARRNNKTNEHLLRALVSCRGCMLASVAVAKTFGKNNDRKQRYYVCSGKFNKAHTMPEEKCPSRYAPAEQLEEIVWKDLCEVLSHPESITDALRRAHGGQWLPQELKARQENLRQGRAALGRQLERLTEAYLRRSHPARGVPEAPPGPRTKGRGALDPGATVAGASSPANGARWSGRLHRGLLQEST